MSVENIDRVCTRRQLRRDKSNDSTFPGPSRGSSVSVCYYLGNCGSCESFPPNIESPLNLPACPSFLADNGNFLVLPGYIASTDVEVSKCTVRPHQDWLYMAISFMILVIVNGTADVNKVR